MKRFLIYFTCLSLVVCLCFGITVSAEEVDGRTVLNYMDYITAYDLFNPTDGWAYIDFGYEYFTSHKQDLNGTSLPSRGQRVWNLTIANSSDSSAHVISQFPGGMSNDVFLDLNNVPTGSQFQIQAIADTEGIEDYQTEIVVTINSGISYFDENFNFISDDWSSQLTFRFYDSERFSQIVELTINKPELARYCTFYSRCNFSTGQSNDLVDSIQIEFQFSKPNLKISTSYTQIIIQGIVNARPPSGSGTIVDVDDLEDILNGSTAQGREEAEKLFQSAPEVIEQFFSAFVFMNMTLSSLVSSAWFSSILTVSLSLGLFSYVVNMGNTLGRSVEHRGSKGGKK